MICEICGEETDYLHKHHLIPRCKGGSKGEVINCCLMCNGQVHMLFTESELSNMSKNDLISHGLMRKYVKWKKKHPGKHKLKMSKRVKKKKGI